MLLKGYGNECSAAFDTLEETWSAVALYVAPVLGNPIFGFM